VSDPFTTEPMRFSMLLELVETWRKCFRDGIAPELSTAGLLALKAALESDDSRLISGATTVPPPLQCVLDWNVEGACPIGIAGWLGDGRQTVREVEEHFARVCYGADNRLGEPAASRYFLNAWDEGPRDRMRAELLEEVNRELESRGALPATAA
jgi:hypothetical protein